MHAYVPAHRYVKSVAVWDLIVDDGLYIDRLQLELDGDINEPWRKRLLVIKGGNTLIWKLKKTFHVATMTAYLCVCVCVCARVCACMCVCVQQR